MNYRPEEWKNPYEMRVSTDKASEWADNIRDLQLQAFEKGADAMLEVISSLIKEIAPYSKLMDILK